MHVLHVEAGRTLAGTIFGARDRVIEHWAGTPARQALAEARAVLDAAGIRAVELVGADDDTPRAILQTAQQHSCSVIAMGTRGLGPLTGLLLGSVAHGVLEQAPANVAAVVLVQ